MLLRQVECCYGWLHVAMARYMSLELVAQLLLRLVFARVDGRFIVLEFDSYSSLVPSIHHVA